MNPGRKHTHPNFLNRFLTSLLMMTLMPTLLCGIQIANAADVGTTISYQGRLDDAGAPANGSYDFKFSLYDDLAAGTQVGSTLSQTLTVTDGIFDTTLDFGGGAFTNDARFLQIEIWFLHQMLFDIFA